VLTIMLLGIAKSKRDDHAGRLEVTVSVLIKPMRQQAALTPVLDLALAHPRQTAEITRSQRIALAQLLVRVEDKRLLTVEETVPQRPHEWGTQDLILAQTL
jgi:hypothetical protein